VQKAIFIDDIQKMVKAFNGEWEQHDMTLELVRRNPGNPRRASTSGKWLFYECYGVPEVVDAAQWQKERNRAEILEEVEVWYLSCCVG